MTEITLKDEKKSSHLTATSTLRNLNTDRFVFTHFFFLFVLCFVVGVIFLHSTINLWNYQTNEDVLMNLLELATHGFNLGTKDGKTWDSYVVTLSNASFHRI
ncbi:uncharacterized protein LOC124818429 [Hydra vulgaris]|uniref:uncharacterized protein LOC124818429 n=1 Tax=Hydra vulgaris TaxID=6087 RepID=UPI001F5E9BC2|nr:uncharacterized protein LOC124818429 [Hydra vulgaris]